MSAPDVPELKKKEEKEKKGGAVAWANGTSQAPNLLMGGARGGAGGLSSGGGLLGRGAGWLARTFGSDMATMVGAGALVAGTFAVVYLVYSIGASPARGPEAQGAFLPYKSPEAASAPGSFSPAGGSSLEYFQAANNLPADAQPVEAAAEPEAAEPPPEQGAVVTAEPRGKPKVAIPKPELKVAKNFAEGAKVGGGGLPAGAGAAAAAALPGANLAAPPVKTGKSEKMDRRKRPMVARGIKTLNGRANRAMGQLKLADRLSSRASGTAQEAGARTFAADAFDQRMTLGETAPGISPTSGGTPLEGTGAGVYPDTRQITPVNETPYQDEVDQAQEDNNMAMMLTIMGGMLLAMGGALAAVGRSLMSNPLTASQGKAILAIGLAMMAAGAAMLIAGLVMSQQSKNKGDNVANQHGQLEQGTIVNECADMAVQPASCNPSPLNIPQSTVQQDVQAESTAGFAFDNGGPI